MCVYIIISFPGWKWGTDIHAIQTFILMKKLIPVPKAILNKMCRNAFCIANGMKQKHYVCGKSFDKLCSMRNPVILVLPRPLIYSTGLFVSPSRISELDCATTKTDMAERSISIGRESLQVFFCTRGLGVLPGSTARG